MTRKSILVVDDEVGTRESLRAVFSSTYKTLLAETADEALERLRAEPVDLMLLDICMPARDGLSLLREAREIYPNMPVIMVTATTSDDAVIGALRAGAHDYVVKPFDVNDLRQTVARALDALTLNRRVEALEDSITRHYPIHGIIGMAPAFRRTIEEAVRLGNDTGPVLIRGEAGTGKELIARLIHASSDRRSEPFLAIRCADSSPGDLFSRVFGEQRDPINKAHRLQPGALDLVGGGTLFLRGVRGTPEEFQTRLASAVETGLYVRRNGNSPIGTSFRLVLAMGTPDSETAGAPPLAPSLLGSARASVLQIPPLRERVEDIPLLAHYFLNLLRIPDRDAARDFEPAAMDLLRGYPWPGNVRELRNVIERLLVVHGSSPAIEAASLPREFQTTPVSPDRAIREGAHLADVVEATERQLIESALQQANGVQARAAEILGTTRRILKYRMDRLNIASGAERR